jgi:hypothetical protein
MKIQTIDAQAWWIALADEIRPSEGFDLAETCAAIARAFNFSVAPTAPAKPGAGLDFESGSFRNGESLILISKITVFNDGVAVYVPTNTANAETVLQKLLSILFAAGVRQPSTQPLHYYLSTIVSDFERSLDRLIPASLLTMVSEAIPVEADAHFLSIAINADKHDLRGRLSGINPTSFNIGRRLEMPYETNRYFSQANATTEKHIELLEHLESLV